MDEQKNTIIIFNEKADAVLLDIIKKYSLQETDTEVFEKYKVGKFPIIVIIDHLARDFALEIISEKDLINSLQKDLGVSPQTAEKISKDVVENLIPLLVRVSEDQLTSPEELLISEDQLEDYDAEEQARSNYNTVAPIKTYNEPLEIEEKLEKTKRAELPKITQNLEKRLEKKPGNIQKRGPDIYREPIE